MRRLTGIAALLIFVLTPLTRACASVSHGAEGRHDCCEHKAAPCGEMSSNLCCAMQAPVDTTPYPMQSVMPLVSPAGSVAVVYDNRVDDLTPRSVALDLPAQHPPPGLVIAATIVLRI